MVLVIGRLDRAAGSRERQRIEPRALLDALDASLQLEKELV